MHQGPAEREDAGTTPLLQLRNVSKSFPGVKALQDMHLELRRGEVLALVGENGAGKSTLMKLLSGIYTADEGEFFLNGEPLQVTGPKQAQEQGISIIHQEFNLMPDLTVAQNIWFRREPLSRWRTLHRGRLRRWTEDLLPLVEDPADPLGVTDLMTHEVSMEEAPAAYANFQKKQDGCIKVVLKP